MVDHIGVKRMWRYVQMKLELTAEEVAHMTEGKRCASLFRICALTERSSALDKELQKRNRQDTQSG